ncbi:MULTISPECIES: Cof-type HAD-IIB family hydrolase [unclassified Microbacterium]|uniref:Cof-type HAD-IIB family hydrolase n=1 Tax=unclassified Microbacterium TaxID=2609290 RepID=UPI00214C510D|nr:MULTISPECIES: Cof-type HAD-IIB family hydrolase [unclassified Microbacterium]MCR2783352.1 Cof-type HAD-IIB family hydrolase [Microbacterium sp. zg.B96]WIM15776.1 Cof-type HAD-IIB family hydrolase [Microbacterium sp. zg-B96]
MTAPRIAFLDVDGTILDHGRTIAASTVEAVRAARAAGCLVYLSTGRSAGDIHPDVRAIGFDGAITNGGAYATSGEETIVADAMPRDAVERLMAYFERRGIPYFLQTDAAVYASPEVQAATADLMNRWLGVHAEADEPQTAPQGAPRFRDLAEIDLDHVAKAVFLGEATDTVAHAQAELGDRFHVVPGSMPLPGGSNGEIGMRGTTKGSAILKVLDHLGIDPSASIGIGDSWNDVEMFEVCGVGIAMGNAEPELKERADEVTTSVREDGVWNAFVRHGLVAG